MAISYLLCTSPRSVEYICLSRPRMLILIQIGKYSLFSRHDHELCYSVLGEHGKSIHLGFALNGLRLLAAIQLTVAGFPGRLIT